MKPYDPTRDDCLKCGNDPLRSEKPKYKYVPTKRSEAAGVIRELQHLKVSCGRCGYCVNIPCRDAKERK